MLCDLNPTTTPEPTTLRSLQRYASHQTELIESLLDPSSPNHHFRDCDDEYWVQFWLSVWDKDPDSLDETEKVEGDPDPIDGSPILSDVVPSNRDVMNQPGAYREAEEFALSVCGGAAKYDGLVIAGQPGIGKSVFLLRILLRRLALKLPTALQIRPNHALLFCRGGVKEFSRLENRSVYHPLKSEHGPPGRIWVLVDSNRELHEPAPAFQEGFFFVVEVSSPRPSRHEWIRGIRSMSFYMKSWSFMEVLQAQVDLPAGIHNTYIFTAGR
ncbi:hypothetical protein BDM02DRAFT_3187371 [Thelephora ganbajun]|uniref:Uncharacterized protein n=1 Tax=Thelephora ganbajun TaxID=370292 RepID=A0ACB6ZG02_THEGA|nr:hypothetical protein BDM02DRAFT_3187371 [Thelephora ganbajun]